jgi:hypothetical protein
MAVIPAADAGGINKIGTQTKAFVQKNYFQM